MNTKDDFAATNVIPFFSDIEKKRKSLIEKHPLQS
jgi:hypothetical protein